MKKIIFVLAVLLAGCATAPTPTPAPPEEPTEEFLEIYDEYGGNWSIYTAILEAHCTRLNEMHYDTLGMLITLNVEGADHELILALSGYAQATLYRIGLLGCGY